VLAIDITRDGFEWALTNSCLSHFEIGTYESLDIWAQRLSVSRVRIQWDPERDELHRPLTHRSIQIGLTGEAARRYIDEWTVSITDVTNLFHRVGGEVERGNLAKAQALMPVEIVYPVTGDLIDTTGASLT
jgi:hypothetical protein